MPQITVAVEYSFGLSPTGPTFTHSYTGQAYYNGTSYVPTTAISGYPPVVNSYIIPPNPPDPAEWTVSPDPFNVLVETSTFAPGEYLFRVRYFNTASGLGNLDFIGTGTVVPFIQLSASSLACCTNNPTLSWFANVGDTDTSFTLYRSDAIGGVVYNGPLLTFTDSGLSYETAHDYWVVGNQSGIQSNTVTVTPHLCAPPSAPAAPLWDGVCRGPELIITWPAVSGVDSWVLKRNGTQVYAGTALTYDDKAVVMGTSYSYTLAGVNCGGTGAFSAALTCAPCRACNYVPVPQPACSGYSPVPVN
jgi:hypothetical protein